MSDIVSKLMLDLYATIGMAALPFTGAFLNLRVRNGKEDKARLSERCGHASIHRMEGRLTIWVHAASLGETRAVLPLVKRLVDMDFQVVFTTVTVTAARIASVELPKGAFHQFVPLDFKPYVQRFLKHWRPSLAIFVESELWPTTMTELRHNHIPQIQVNGRMSERSFKRWKRFDIISNALFENISLCIAQTEQDAERFKELGVHSVMNSGNLKFDSELPDVDVASLAKLQNAIGNRPLWLAASTHDREEAIVAKAHRQLKKRFPDLLTLIAPRHPERADEIIKAVQTFGLSISQRSKGQLPTSQDDIYLADTIGELGLFYSLAPCSLIGGSLVPHGGQNPIEPARLGSAIIHGPNVNNFSQIFKVLEENKASICVHNSEELVRYIANLLDNRDLTGDMTQAAKISLKSLSGALEKTHQALLPYLNPLIVAGRLADMEILPDSSSGSRTELR